MEFDGIKVMLSLNNKEEILECARQQFLKGNIVLPRNEELLIEFYSSKYEEFYLVEASSMPTSGKLRLQHNLRKKVEFECQNNNNR